MRKKQLRWAKGPAMKTRQALDITGVKQLGRMLIEVGNKYPLDFVTEMDYYPLVLAFLHGRAPNVKTEVSIETGSIDFRIGGANPVHLELAVTKRTLVDQDAAATALPSRGELYASQNLAELRKLSTLPPSKSRGNFLLLIDTQRSKAHVLGGLKKLYADQTHQLGPHAVRVIYVNRSGEEGDFRIKGNTKAIERKK